MEPSACGLSDNKQVSFHSINICHLKDIFFHMHLWLLQPISTQPEVSVLLKDKRLLMDLLVLQDLNR